MKLIQNFSFLGLSSFKMKSILRRKLEGKLQIKFQINLRKNPILKIINFVKVKATFRADRTADLEKRLELVRKISNKINLKSRSNQTQPSESSLFCSVDKSCNFINKNIRSFKSCLTIFNATLQKSDSLENIKPRTKSVSSIRRRLTDCNGPHLSRSIDYLNLEYYTQRSKHRVRPRRAASLPQVCQNSFASFLILIISIANARLS